MRPLYQSNLIKKPVLSVLKSWNRSPNLTLGTLKYSLYIWFLMQSSIDPQMLRQDKQWCQKLFLSKNFCVQVEVSTHHYKINELTNMSHFSYKNSFYRSWYFMTWDFQHIITSNNYWDLRFGPFLFKFCHNKIYTYRNNLLLTFSVKRLY